MYKHLNMFRIRCLSCDDIHKCKSHNHRLEFFSNLTLFDWIQFKPFLASSLVYNSVHCYSGGLVYFHPYLIHYLNIGH